MNPSVANSLRPLVFLAIVLMFSSDTVAQVFRVYGEVAGRNKMPVVNAQIDLLREGSRTKLSAASDIQGRFYFDNVKSGKFFMRIVASGYSTYVALVEVSDITYLGSINLTDTTLQLAEVTISSSVIPLKQNYDTTTYDARAFKSFADADAWYLLSKMPAFKMSGSSVTVDGDSVSRLVLNGQNIFNGQIEEGLRSIPATAIDKVQTYNDRSDREKMTGFKESGAPKVIEIKTKAGFKMPQGKAHAGGGDNGAYAIGTQMNRLSNSEQVNVQGSSNNVNFRPNSIPDPELRNIPQGINKKSSVSLNYTKTLSEKLSVGFTYSYDRNNSFQKKNRTLQYILPDSSETFKSESHIDGLSQDHRMTANIIWQINSQNTLRFNSSFIPRTNRLKQHTSIWPAAFINHNYSDNFQCYSQLSNGLNYTHGFHKRGRTIGLTLSQGISTSATDNTFESISQTNSPLQATQQNISGETEGNTYRSALSYTEPFGKYDILEATYSISQGLEQTALYANNFSPTEGAYTVPNDSLSNSYSGTNFDNRVGLKNKYQNGKATISGGFDFNFISIKGSQRLPVEFGIDRKFLIVLPSANLQYAFTPSRSVSFSYSSQTNPIKPSLFATVLNNTDPLQYRAGNPGLQPEVRHFSTLKYQSTNNKRGTKLTYSIGTIYAHNYLNEQLISPLNDTIIYGKTVGAGTQLLLPVNFGNYRYVNSRVSCSLPLKAVKCNLKAEAEMFFSRGSILTNEKSGYRYNKGGELTLGLSSNISEKIDFNLTSNTYFRLNYYTASQYATDNFIQQATTFFVWYSFIDNVYVTTNFSMLNNGSSASGINANLYLLDLSMGIKIFKKKADMRLSINDIFNQNKKVEHNVTGSYIEDTRAINVQRYLMLLFTFNF